MRKLSSLIIFGAWLGFLLGALGSPAHAQVTSPNYFKSVGGNVYPINASNTIGTSSVNGAFNNLTVSGTCTGCGGGGGSSTSTINGALGPVFNFVASSTGNVLSLASTTSGGSSTITFLLQLQNYLQAALKSLNGATSSAQTIVGGTGESVTTVSGAGNSTTTVTNTGVTSFNTASGTITYGVTCTSGCTVASTTTSAAITVTASGGGVQTSTNLTANTLPIATGAGTIGNSSLSEPGGGVTSKNGVPVLDGAGDYIGPNIYMGPTSTVAVGNLVQNGGVQPLTASTTLTGAQFCGGGAFIITSSTGPVTITVPTMATLASSTLTPCASSIWAGGFSMQTIENSSTQSVQSATNGAGEVQQYSPGTSATLNPGQTWLVVGQFVNTSTVMGATATGTVLQISYTLEQTSTPLTVNGNSVNVNNTLTIGGAQTSTIQGNGNNTTISKLNTIFYVPSNFATAGCVGSSTATELGACVNAIVQSQTFLASTTNPGGVTIWITNSVTKASNLWNTPWNFNVNGLIVSVDCAAGVSLGYNGSGPAATWNVGNPAGHVVSDDYGCTYMGSSTLLAGGAVNNATTTGIVFGGNQGAVGIDFHDNNINGFGLCWQTGANTYMVAFHNNSVSGCGNSGAKNFTGTIVSTSSFAMSSVSNVAGIGVGWNINGPGIPNNTFVASVGTSTLTLTKLPTATSTAGNFNIDVGTLMYIAQASNSGERFDVTQNSFTDPANSTSANALYVENNALASGNFCLNSIDDATVYIGISNGLENWCWEHFENAAYLTYPMQEFILASSSGATNLNVNWSVFALDNTGATGKLPQLIEHAVNLVFDDNIVENYGGASAITNCIDHTLNPGQAVESFNNDWSQNGACSNWAQLSGVLYPSLNMEMTNGYPLSITVDGGGNGQIWTGQADNFELQTGGALEASSKLLAGATYVTASTTLQATGSNASVRAGSLTSASHGCFELYDAVNSSTLMYIYSSSSVLIDTSTKPAFCQ